MWGCGKDSAVTPVVEVPVPSVEFSSAATMIEEGQNLTVSLTLSEQLPEGVVVQIDYAPGTGMEIGANGDAYFEPDPVSNSIMFEGPLTVLEFKIYSRADTDAEGVETIVFTLASTEGVEVGTKNSVTISLSDAYPRDGLVAEYKFSGNLLDTSGEGNNGTNNGATLTTDKSGKPASAYSVHGSGYITVPNSTETNFSTNANFTISVWVKPAAVQNDLGGIINDVIRPWLGNSQGYPFGISYYNTTKTFSGARYDGSGCGNGPEVTSAAVDAQFHHVVYRKSGSTLQLFVNNVLAGSTTDATVCSTANSSDMFIGCRGNLLRCFTGTIDDIRIYNRALSSEEISVLFMLP